MTKAAAINSEVLSILFLIVVVNDLCFIFEIIADMYNVTDIKKALSLIPDPEIPVISIEELGVLRDVSYKGKELVVLVNMFHW
mgnify:CR=1 FL=1